MAIEQSEFRHLIQSIELKFFFPSSMILRFQSADLVRITYTYCDTYPNGL